MPTTNRPFFANFFAAFRQQSPLQKTSPAIAASSTSAAAAAAGSPSLHTQAFQASAATASSAQPISVSATSKAGQHSTSTSASAAVASAAAAPNGAQSHFAHARPLHPPSGTPHSRGHSRSPDAHGYSTSPGQSAASAFGMSRSPSQTARPPSPGVNPQFPYSPPSYGAGRQRRESDTSDRSGNGVAGGGAMWPGAEKWYIGGRTAAGEERFYKLGLVKKYDSNDRLSLDRLSL